MSKFQVTSKEFDANGTFTVTVVAPFPRTSATDAGVRRAARAADPMGQVKHTSIRRVVYVPGEGLRFTVAATRLPDPLPRPQGPVS